MAKNSGFPENQGLYDNQFEKDSCGVGFVVNIKGEKTHIIVKKGLEVLVNLTHRGAVGSDPKTGDGAGILVQLPDEFFRIKCESIGIELPKKGKFAVGMIFLPKEPALRLQCEGIVERVVEEEGQKVLGWRFVPTDNRGIGETAKGTEPIIRQIFIESTIEDDEDSFERRLYIIRKRAESEVKRLVKRNKEYFYICSLSCRTIVYKGLLLADQINDFYVDLQDINFKSALCLVHQRYSTNTFPTWDLAQPFRYLAHNGEINTIRGNRNWMNAREGVLKSKIFGEEIKKLFPIINPSGSDSASLDNTLELLNMDGRSIAHSFMMLVPEAWRGNKDMAEYKRAFYEFHGSLIEPWDGPAAVAFTDGVRIGAALDRNGLRPARYIITKSGLAVLSSEVGVLNFRPEEIERKGKLQPGKMILIDTIAGKVIDDEEIKKTVCNSKPYADMIKKNKLNLEDFDGVYSDQEINMEELKEKQQAFGYTMEDIKVILYKMAKDASEPMGSMGNDTPPAVLSNKSQLLFSYFKELFAQVTNPPIDPIRERTVMSLMNYIGAQEDILNQDNIANPFMEIYRPIISNKDMCRIKALRNSAFKTTTIPITFKYDTGIEGFKEALEKICERASKRIEEGYNIIVLSDRQVDSYEAAVPSLLAVSAVHHHLVKEKTRSRVSIIVETGEARETIHFALMVGYGATAVNPYLAFETIREMIKDKELEDISESKAIENYMQAVSSGLLKILSKMGISTLQSYQGAQIFEALGLSSEFIDNYFEGTPSRIGGIGVETVAKQALLRHRNAFNKIRKPVSELEVGGNYAYRKEGEYHLNNPETIYKLQLATRRNDYKMYKEYAEAINEQNKNLCTIRGLFDLKFENSISIEEVEPISEILKRFCTGAMSFGSISKETHETIAIAMNRMGGRSNTGEGGEENERFKVDDNGDSRRSAIKQIASARFGVTTEYLMNADELQIKIAQGAKPGEGGHLPGGKVDVHIARVRHSTPGCDLISPPPHHDIYSIEDLAQLIHDLKCVNPWAKISVKLVSEVGVGTIAAGVAKARADLIVISGGDGGTGAAPLSSIKYAGIPWELGLSETQQVLLLNNLRSRVKIQTDGQIKTGKDVVIAALLGAEEYGFATSVLVVLGCTMMRHCHLNTCDMGIATQDPELRKNFSGKPEYIINMFRFIAQEVREYMAKLGFRTMNEMIGRTDMIIERKAKGLDLSKILYKPDMPKRIKPYCVLEQDHGIDKSLDYKLIEMARDALSDGKKLRASMEIKNVNRSVGAMLSGEIAFKYGNAGLAEDTIVLEFTGSAGQSFGAFAVNGLTLKLNGDANDYVAKGLSGGRIIIKTPEGSTFKQDENYIAGNTLLYGATSGKVFINGLAGERFAVRNSGAVAVVEGIGDHGCEYMTGGTVVIIGKTGRNFGAGMSGGIAFVLDEDESFYEKCNMEMIEVASVEDSSKDEKWALDDYKEIYDLIKDHYEYTNSAKAFEILNKFDDYKLKFKKVIPTVYKKYLENARRTAAGEVK